MQQVWQLQEAKNKFSQVVEEAVQHGPQIVTKRGVEVAVVISYSEYRRMMAERKNIVDFFRESPLVGVELDLSRSKSKPRVALEL